MTDRLEPDGDTPLYVRNDMALQNGITKLRDESRKADGDLAERVTALEGQLAEIKQNLLLVAAMKRGSGPTA